jgi:hypothetical protein
MKQRNRIFFLENELDIRTNEVGNANIECQAKDREAARLRDQCANKDAEIINLCAIKDTEITKLKNWLNELVKRVPEVQNPGNKRAHVGDA